jgi:hypothetical protein
MIFMITNRPWALLSTGSAFCVRELKLSAEAHRLEGKISALRLKLQPLDLKGTRCVQKKAEFGK